MNRKQRKKQATKKRNRILEAWDMFEDQDPDISSERLLAMVQDYTGFGADTILEVVFRREIDTLRDELALVAEIVREKGMEN